MIDEPPLLILVDEPLFACFFHEFRHAVERPVQRHSLPTVRVRLAVQHILLPVWIHRQLEAIRALGAERTFVDRTVGIAFDVDELPAFGVDVQTAPNSAVWANTLGDGRPAESRSLLLCLSAEWLGRTLFRIGK